MLFVICEIAMHLSQSEQFTPGYVQWQWVQTHQACLGCAVDQRRLNEHTFSVFDIPPVRQGAKKLNELDCSLTCNLKQSKRFHHLVHPPCIHTIPQRFTHSIPWPTAAAVASRAAGQWTEWMSSYSCNQTCTCLRLRSVWDAWDLLTPKSHHRHWNSHWWPAGNTNGLEHKCRIHKNICKAAGMHLCTRVCNYALIYFAWAVNSSYLLMQSKLVALFDIIAAFML